MRGLDSLIRSDKPISPTRFLVLSLLTGAYLGVLTLLAAAGAASVYPWHSQNPAVIGERVVNMINQHFHEHEDEEGRHALLSFQFMSQAPRDESGCASREVREVWDGLRPEAERLGATDVMIQPSTFKVLPVGWGFPMGWLGGVVCLVERNPDGTWNESNLAPSRGTEATEQKEAPPEAQN